MYLIRNILILLAGLILLLHTVLPHEHHSELDVAEHVSQHESAKGLLDFVRLAFHLDQGEGHLEKYQGASSNFLFHAIPTLSTRFHPLIRFEKSFPIFCFEKSLPSRFASSQLRFRGPPHQA